MSERRHGVLAAIGFGAVCAATAAVGTLTMRGRGKPDGLWFRALRKPSFQPSNRVFAPVWTVLYGMIAYSGYRIWKAPDSTERTAALALWATQLVLNAAWTPLFFGAQRPKAALADLIALDVAATSYLALARKVDKVAAATVLPYLGWLGFATALNGKIVANNPRFLLD